jgi:hypothetical protein
MVLFSARKNLCITTLNMCHTQFAVGQYTFPHFPHRLTLGRIKLYYKKTQNLQNIVTFDGLHLDNMYLLYLD